MKVTESAPIRIDAPPLGYEPALDGIRALAVLIVMAYHFGANQWLHGGVITVDWFFVLSGFLITNLLLDERNRNDSISLKGFYHRRILRLFPAMYAFLGFVFVAAIALPTLRNEVPDIWAELAAAGLYSYQLFIGFFGLGTPESPRALLHLWTLSVEEWFYFFWPILLVWSLVRVRSQKILLAGSAVFIAFWVGVRLLAGAMGVTEESVGNGTSALDILFRFSIMRFDVLVMGCMIAIVRRRIVPLTPQGRKWIGISGAAGGALVLLFLLGSGRLPFFGPFFSVGYNLALFGVAAAALWLHFNPTTAIGRFMSIPFLVYVGKRSYGLYLWHEVPNRLPADLFGYGKLAWGLRAMVVYALSFALAELSWRLVESPFLRRKHRQYANISGR